MTKDLNARFDRLKSETPAPPPPLADVHLSARRLRRRRRAVRVTVAAAGVVALAVAGVATNDRLSRPAPPALITPTLVTPSPTTGPDPAPSPTSGRALVTTPPASASGSSPAGSTPAATTGYADFLQPGDLGDGWTARVVPATGAAGLEYQSCTTLTPAASAATPRRERYTSHSDVGQGLRTVEEAAVRVSSGDAARIRSTLTAAASCTLPAGNSQTVKVIAAGDGMLVVGTLLPSGAIEEAAGYAITGTTLVQVASSLGYDSAPSGFALPGQGPQAVQLLADAVARLSGTRPALAPRAAFRGSTAAPAAAPGPRVLQRSDLGGEGHWTPPPPTYSAGSLPLALPACLPSATSITPYPADALTVTGTDQSQQYYGWATYTADAAQDDPWQLDEDVWTLSPTVATRVRTALTTAATCRYLTGQSEEPALPVLTTTPSGTVVAARSTGGHLQSGAAWILKGTTLVHLRTSIVRRSDLKQGHPAPVAPSWLVDLARTAATRVG